MLLLDLAAVVRSFGRGVILRAPAWDFASDLTAALAHLADTEGNIVINTNAELAKLTLPELSGPAAIEVDYTGEDPVITVPMYLTDPEAEAIITPSGTRSAGRSRRSSPAEHTIVIIPEGVFLRDPDPDGIVEAGVLTYSGAAWLLDGSPIGAAREVLLSSSFWLWRAVFNRPPRTFFGGSGDARKQIHEVTIQSMQSPLAPEGHRLYTIGDPALSGIDPTVGIES
jgi:hypothetical protein